VSELQVLVAASREQDEETEKHQRHESEQRFLSPHGTHPPKRGCAGFTGRRSSLALRGARERSSHGLGEYAPAAALASAPANGS
jgi:hypothetical protein